MAAAAATEEAAITATMAAAITPIAAATEEAAAEVATTAAMAGTQAAAMAAAEDEGAITATMAGAAAVPTAITAATEAPDMAAAAAATTEAAAATTTIAAPPATTAATGGAAAAAATTSTTAATTEAAEAATIAAMAPAEESTQAGGGGGGGGDDDYGGGGDDDGDGDDDDDDYEGDGDNDYDGGGDDHIAGASDSSDDGGSDSSYGNGSYGGQNWYEGRGSDDEYNDDGGSTLRYLSHAVVGNGGAPTHGDSVTSDDDADSPSDGSATDAINAASVTTTIPTDDMPPPSLLAAAGAYVTQLCRPGKLARMLAGVHTLDLHACLGVTDAVLSSLPPSLRVLTVSECRALTPLADFTHLTALTSLDCSNTAVLGRGVDRLPPSLCELRMDDCALPPTADLHQLPSLQLLSASTSPAAGTASTWLHGVSLVHLTQLRVLRVSFSGLDDSALASLPVSLLELDACLCRALTPAASFAHLTQLRELDVTLCSISDASLTSLPPSLVSLKALNCPLTPAAVLPHLPLLQVVEVSLTAAGDALVASLPYGLAELGLADCARVTRAAKLGHLLGLRVLHCSATSVSPDELAARRARGCVAPAAAVLRAHSTPVHSMAMLANGRLASGDMGGWIVMGDTVVRDAAGTTLREVGTTPVRAMVALPNRRLALGTVGLVFPDGGIDVWDVDVRRPVRKAARRWGCGVPALAVLPDGCLAAGFLNGVLRFVDVSAGPPAVVAAVKVHTGAVMALALLPGGMLASGSYDGTVRLWNVGTRACIGTLVSRPTAPPLCSMAVLADGRLACGANDGTVALWDVGARTCVGMLAGHQCGTTALLALPDGRLVSCDGLGAIRLWDTRPAAAEASVRAAGTPSMVTMEAGRIGIPIKALVLVGENRIATGHVSGPLRTWHVPPLPPA